MKLSTLKATMKEVVKEVIQEELKEILLEAVKSNRPLVTESHNSTSNPSESKQPALNRDMIRENYKNALNNEFSFTSNQVTPTQGVSAVPGPDGGLPQGEVSIDQIMQFTKLK